MLRGEDIEVLWDALLTVGADKAWRSSLGHVLLRVSEDYGDIARLTGRYQPWDHGCGTSLQIAVEARIYLSPRDAYWELPGYCHIGDKRFEAFVKWSGESERSFAICPKCLAVLFSEAT